MTLQLIKRLRARRAIHAAGERGHAIELNLPTASIAVVPSGIVARMQPPFSKLTGSFPWQFVPGGFAALRVLTEGEKCESVRAVEMALGVVEPHPALTLHGSQDDWRTRRRTRDVIALEDSDVWVDDANRIVWWGAEISQLCPVASVARDLRRVPTMRPAELDKLVRGTMQLLG